MSVGQEAAIRAWDELTHYGRWHLTNHSPPPSCIAAQYYYPTAEVRHKTMDCPHVFSDFDSQQLHTQLRPVRSQINVMPPTRPPEPPNDSIEAPRYAIKDKVYFLLHGKGCRNNLAPDWWLTSHIAGVWRAGEVRDHEGSSEESPRYLVSIMIQDLLWTTCLTWNARATGSRREKPEHV